jgi:GAF domain-containing protein
MNNVRLPWCVGALRFLDHRDQKRVTHMFRKLTNMLLDESSGQPSTKEPFPADARAAQRVEEMLKVGVSRREILDRLVSAAEEMAGPGAVCSILALDHNGLLRNAASPGLPADYLRAIDGLKPDPEVGTCAAAAATGSVVLTPDFQADDKWAELRHLPLALGFVGAWSVPIKSADGTVLGTFGTYFTVQRCPTADEQSGVEQLAAAAAVVLAR